MTETAKIVQLHSRTAKGKRGILSHFVPEDFEVPESDIAWARAEHPNLDLYFETQKFRDCEFQKPHSDWRRAWRNWVRRADEFRR